jgi:hypothetical protein
VTFLRISRQIKIGAGPQVFTIDCWPRKADAYYGAVTRKARHPRSNVWGIIAVQRPVRWRRADYAWFERLTDQRPEWRPEESSGRAESTSRLGRKCKHTVDKAASFSDRQVLIKPNLTQRCSLPLMLHLPTCNFGFEQECPGFK